MIAFFAASLAWSAQRIDPEIPTEALTRSQLDERCDVRVAVDPKGFVYQLEVTGCSDPYAGAAASALWRWVIPPEEGVRSFAVPVRFAVIPPAEGGTGSAQVLVGEPAMAVPFPDTEPKTVPLSSLTIEKQKEPDVSATMIYLSQEKGIVEVFCRVDLVVGEKGKVEQVAIAECHPDLVDPITKAVAKWRFSATDGLAGGRKVTLVMPVRSFTETRGLGAQ